MRGYITKRGKSYRIIVSLGFDPTIGKYRQQAMTVNGTKKEAERKLAELIQLAESGMLIASEKMNLGQFLDRWLKDYAQVNLSPRTAESYEYLIEKLKPHIGKVELGQLRSSHIQGLYAKLLSSGTSRSIVEHSHNCLHNALNHAVKWGLVAQNVAKAVSPPRVRQGIIRVLDEDSLIKVLEAAKETPYYPLFYLLAYTGIRRGEALGLRWCDVDLTLGQMYVNQSLQMVGGEVLIQPPKTARSRRAIDLTPSTVIMLRNHLDQQMQLANVLGATLNNDSLVFSQVDGKPFLPDTVTHVWIRLVEKAEVKHVRLHDLRHTHATILLKSGIHPKIVQERLGHARISTTLDTYSHVVPGLQAQAARCFDQLMGHEEKDYDQFMTNSGDSMVKG